VAFAHTTEFSFFGINVRATKELLDGSVQSNEGVGGHEPGFEVGQRADAEVVRPRVHLLVHHQRDEAAELRDLDGDGLDVHTVNAVLDEGQLAAVVELIGAECLLDVVEDALAHRGVGNLGGLGELSSLPALVAGIELTEHKDELVQDAHGERAGTAGGIENLEVVNGLDEGVHLGGRILVRLVAVGEELTQAFLGVLCTRASSFQLRLQAGRGEAALPGRLRRTIERTGREAGGSAASV
jgi:hypothetical protein